MDKDGQNSPAPPPPPQTSDDGDQVIVPFSSPDDDGYAEKVKKFTKFILESGELASPTKPLSPEFMAFLGKRIKEIFPQLKQSTPDHPPYQIMIRDAINSMDEEGGSTAEAISQFIQREYPDLPYDHNAFLQHYLEELCQDGFVAKNGRRYRMCRPDLTPCANLSVVCRGESNPSIKSGTSFVNVPKRTRRESEKAIVVKPNEPQSSLVPKSMKGNGRKDRNVKSIDNGKVEKEVDKNADILMLEGPKGSVERTGGRCRAVLACHDPITGKRRILIDIDLDELEDLVNDDPLEMDLVEGSTEKSKNSVKKAKVSDEENMHVH